MRVLVAVRRIGPYHHSRFSAAAAGIQLHVLESRPLSQEYPWAFQPEASYSIHQLSGHHDPEIDPPLATLQRQLVALLDAHHPQVLVSVGWVDHVHQHLLRLAHQRKIPLVLISDSRQSDEPRSAPKEWLKHQLLRGYGAALVAGSESRAYLISLGFPAAAIHQPWDVVDNGFFEQAAAAAGPRQPHFLCVSRLVAKKNHHGLLEAYGAYQRQGGTWGLQLVGSGPMQAAIKAQIQCLPDPARVQLLPFRQLEELGHLYGRASAFVLASVTDQWGLVVNEAMAAGLPCLVSRACGCASDLIDHGGTGWSFDPADTSSLTALLHTMEQQLPDDRSAMVAAARLRLQAFSPQSFASGLQKALHQALAQPRWSTRATLAARVLELRP